MNARTAAVSRCTLETDIRVRLDLDPAAPGGPDGIDTGLGFLDHMLETFAAHAGVDLAITCRDLKPVDDHHAVEDCALAIGTALDRALDDRAGVRRFGSALVPMDESLARAAVDLSGRPFAAVDLGLRRERLGAVSCENLPHFFASLATAARMTLHLDVLRGDNDHHRAEAAFKAFARAVREAVSRTSDAAVPSTKGVLA
jgi:imidazoleglycerol-phosphate dehydratase